MTRKARSIGFSLLAGIGATALIGCSNEATAPARRFAVLDDVGTSEWVVVAVGTDHTLRPEGERLGVLLGEQSVLPARSRKGRHDLRVGDGVVCLRLVPEAVQPGVKFTSISAGARHTCAITTSREAYCWGANDLGQVGDFAATSPTLVKVAGSLGWSQISAGYSHTCAVRTDGALYCWGANDRGQLGVGSVTTSSGMVRVPVGSPVASVSAGQQRTCARTTLGAVYCWGSTWTARSDGLEISRDQTTPLLVPNSPAMAWLSVGTFTTCGADASGFAYCWEANPRGQMGNGTQDGSTSPASRRVGPRVRSGERRHRSELRRGHQRRRLLLGRRHLWSARRFAVVARRTLRRPAASLRHGAHRRCSARSSSRRSAPDSEATSCGVTVKGNLYCWGLGVSGQRGDGTAGYADLDSDSRSGAEPRSNRRARQHEQKRSCGTVCIAPRVPTPPALHRQRLAPST